MKKYSENNAKQKAKRLCVRGGYVDVYACECGHHAVEVGLGSVCGGFVGEPIVKENKIFCPLCEKEMQEKQ